jgi:hypothetical protein
MNSKGVMSVLTLFAVGIGLTYGVACSKVEKVHAEKQGAEYAKSLGIENAKVNCVDEDTNGDGYVSCTIAVPTKDGGKPDLQPIECAARREGCGTNSGCRVPKERSASQ